MNAAFLYAQLEAAEMINDNRLKTWKLYYDGLKGLEKRNLLDLPVIPNNCEHNAHMFYIKCKNLNERTELIKYLKNNDIHAVFHYIPLHSSEAGKIFGRFHGEDLYTTVESERLFRLPLYYGLEHNKVQLIIKLILGFYCVRA
jgi:dTDP-4-amino-4,6-dideoxygalactose transaminase